jgi:hypothetical protein
LKWKKIFENYEATNEIMLMMMELILGIVELEVYADDAGNWNVFHYLMEGCGVP